MLKEHKTHIVGIGASAGGLEAIIQLVGHLNPEQPFAYVVLQHLSPTYRSMMVEILGRETALKVKEAGQGDLPEPGVIYVVPPSYNALFKDGHLALVAAAPEVSPKPSINQFLISLAAEREESAIGVVLSGTGSDGVAGLRAIQAAGGFTFAQKPETAKYAGMPRAAISAGVADHVLPPAEIALRLPHLLEASLPESEELPPGLLDRLLGLLKEKLRFDFSGYKIGTLMRRIRRREIATGNNDLAAYLAWVEANPKELECLARDILISVTAFFRDQEAFEVLGQAVRNICAGKSPGSEIRVWVAGCASGEEAYSIAMLFAQALGKSLFQYRVQIFATDIDDEALNFARHGVYPAGAMADVPAELLERYFRATNLGFEAVKELRDMIVFARHNLVNDPPFLRLDLVSCRNVLIYFDNSLQAKVLQTFHFGLLKEGLLFLGRSESVGQAESYFSPVDRRERLFRRSDAAAVPPGTVIPTQVAVAPPRRDPRPETMLAGLVEYSGITALLCDSAGIIQHTAGQVGQFLHFPSGATRLAADEVILPALRGELMALLHRFRQSGKRQRGRTRKVGKEWLRLVVEPVQDAGGQSHLILIVPEKHAVEEPPSPAGGEHKHLEEELFATREHLQALVEEMATSNEEMQALHEEAQASNEELQATNEELEASNEELQAANEELISLNEELSVRTAELSRLTEEYGHLYDALVFPILVFDRTLQLVRYNAPAARRFDFLPTALRQHVSRLRLPAGMDGLEALLGRVLAHGDREELTVNLDQSTIRLAITPGFDKRGEIIDLVATVIDITDIVRTQAELAESQTRLSALMEQTTVIFALKDLRGGYLYANRRFLEFFGIEDKDYVGKNDFALLPPAIATELWQQDVAALRQGSPAEGQHLIEWEGQRRHLRSVHQVLLDAAGLPSAFIVEAVDVTARVEAEIALEKELRANQQRLERLVAERTAELTAANRELQSFSYAASHDLKAPLGRISSFSTLLERKYRDRLEGDGLFFLDQIRGNANRMNDLVDDLLAHAHIEQKILSLQPVDLLEVVQGVLRERAVDIENAGAEMRVSLPALKVLGNPHGLSQVLRNLVENALKYSAASQPPTVEIGGEEQGGICRLWVRDNGIGFDMVYHDRIFEIFRRLHTYDEFPGSGVGLALVKKAMERMGGRVWAESMPNQGATFFLELPAVPQDGTAVDAADAAAEETPAAG